MESGCVDTHRGNDGTVLMAFVEAFPGSSESRVGEGVWRSEVLSTRAEVFNVPCMTILVRTDDQTLRQAASAPGSRFRVLFQANVK